MYMFDLEMRDDLLNMNKGVSDITTANYIRGEMRKIIRRRTQEKVDLLNILLQNNAIDINCYIEMMDRAQNDYRKGLLYLVGLCSI